MCFQKSGCWSQPNKFGRFVQFGADQDCYCGAVSCRQKLGVKPSKPNVPSSDAALKIVACQVAALSPKVKAILSRTDVRIGIWLTLLSMTVVTLWHLPFFYFIPCIIMGSLHLWHELWILGTFSGDFMQFEHIIFKKVSFHIKFTKISFVSFE